MVAPTVDHEAPTAPAAASDLRVCSLLPSATEIVGRLGLTEHLVCVTHCCDVAPDPESLDRVLQSGQAVRATSSWIKADTLSQADIDAMVKGTFAAGKPLYGIDASALADKQPTVVITQGLCDVCAPTEGQARAACSLAATSNSAERSGERAADLIKAEGPGLTVGVPVPALLLGRIPTLPCRLHVTRQQ